MSTRERFDEKLIIALSAPLKAQVLIAAAASSLSISGYVRQVLSAHLNGGPRGTGS